MTAYPAKIAAIGAMNINRPCRFLDLPIEIRLQIYNYLTPDEVLVDVPRQKWFSDGITSDLRPPYVLSLGYSHFDACLFDTSGQSCTALRNTCRQVYHEITSILNRVPRIKLEIRPRQNVQTILEWIASSSDDSLSRIRTVEIAFECMVDISHMPYCLFWPRQWSPTRYNAHFSIKISFESDAKSQLEEPAKLTRGWHIDPAYTAFYEQTWDVRTRCIAARESFEQGKLRGNKRAYLQRLVRILSSRQLGHSQELYKYYPPPDLEHLYRFEGEPL